MRFKADRSQGAALGVFSPRRSAVVLTVVLVVGIVLGLGLGYVVLRSQMSTPEQRAAAAAPLQPLTVTTPVLREERQQTVTLTGAVENSGIVAVRPAMPQDGAAAVLVKQSVERGGSVDPGMLVAEISGRPVFAMPGAFPFYRDLTLGDTGEDVTQLQKGLADAGYDSGTVDGELGLSTQRALEQMLRDAGYPSDLLHRGNAEGGQDQADTEEEAASDLLVPRDFFVVLADLPATVVEVTATVGDPLDETSTLFSVANGTLIVSASISTVQAADVTDGQPVTVTLSGQDDELAGTVSGLEADADNPDLSTITITPDSPLPGDAAGNDVRAIVITAATDGAVLVVPIGAVRSDATDNAYVLLAPSTPEGEGVTPERHAVEVLEVIDGAAVLEENTAPAEGTEVIVAQPEQGALPTGDASNGEGAS